MAKRARDPGLWEHPQILAALAGWIAAAAMIALAYAGVLAVLRLPLAPLRSLVVTGSLRHVTAEQIEYVARTSLKGNFFSVRLDELRAGFEKLPWVRQVQLRRRWPGGLEVGIEEHVAAAVWNPGSGEARMVNGHGEVFSAAVPGELALALYGPEGSAPDLLRRSREFAAILAPLARSPRSVALSARAAWQLRLDDGVVIELGRDRPGTPVGERLRRFVAHYRGAAARLPAPITAADLRYPAGFAVRTAAHGMEAKTNR